MHDQPFVSLIIPAYNEEKRISKILDAALTYVDTHTCRLEVIVVNDGSTDETERVVGTYKNRFTDFRLLSLNPNQGKGVAVRAGMLSAQGNIRVFADADNSTSIDQLDHLVHEINQGAKIAIGSRSLPGSRVEVHQSWYKEIGGKLGNALIRLLIIPEIRDTQCGFKAFTAEVAQELFLESMTAGWGFDIEILALARQKGYSIVEY